MKKSQKSFVLGAVCAIAVAVSLVGIEWRGEDGVAFREALKGLSGEGYTRENFDFYYQDLNARNPYMGLWLCILHPWLTWGES